MDAAECADSDIRDLAPLRESLLQRARYLRTLVDRGGGGWIEVLDSSLERTAELLDLATAALPSHIEHRDEAQNASSDLRPDNHSEP